MRDDIKDIKKELESLKKEFDTLENNFDLSNQTRIAEATRNEQTLEKIEELRTKVSKLEERLNDLRVDIASIIKRN